MQHHKMFIACVILILIDCTHQRSQFQSENLQQQSTTRKNIEILKQINDIYPDGSYKVGYENEDGTFRIETRDPLGNVNGIYGYLDEKGELKTVKYGAGNGTGFVAESDLIPKAPRPAGTQQQPIPQTASNSQGFHRQPHPRFQGRPSDDEDDISLTGFSEDKDEDGFVDPLPQSPRGHFQLQKSAADFKGHKDQDDNRFASPQSFASHFNSPNSNPHPLFANLLNERSRASSKASNDRNFQSAFDEAPYIKDDGGFRGFEGVTEQNRFVSSLSGNAGNEAPFPLGNFNPGFGRDSSSRNFHPLNNNANRLQDRPSFNQDRSFNDPLNLLSSRAFQPASVSPTNSQSSSRDRQLSSNLRNFDHPFSQDEKDTENGEFLPIFTANTKNSFDDRRQRFSRPFQSFGFA